VANTAVIIIRKSCDKPPRILILTAFRGTMWAVQQNPSAAANDTDAVTQVQNAITGFASLYYNYLGTLQRDTAPASVAGELLVAPPLGAPPQECEQVMAQDLAAALRGLADAILRLPKGVGTAPDGHQLQQLARLQREDDAATADLTAQLAAAEIIATRLHRVHAALADAQLRAGAADCLNRPPSGSAI
jgi:hypothetical protein